MNQKYRIIFSVIQISNLLKEDVDLSYGHFVNNAYWNARIYTKARTHWINIFNKEEFPLECLDDNFSELVHSVTLMNDDVDFNELRGESMVYSVLFKNPEHALMYKMTS